MFNRSRRLLFSLYFRWHFLGFASACSIFMCVNVSCEYYIITFDNIRLRAVYRCSSLVCLEYPCELPIKCKSFAISNNDKIHLRAYLICAIPSHLPTPHTHAQIDILHTKLVIFKCEFTKHTINCYLKIKTTTKWKYRRKKPKKEDLRKCTMKRSVICVVLRYGRNLWAKSKKKAGYVHH